LLTRLYLFYGERGSAPETIVVHCHELRTRSVESSSNERRRVGWVEIACCIQTRINLGWLHRVYFVEWLASIRLRSYPPVGTANVWPLVTNPRAQALLFRQCPNELYREICKGKCEVGKSISLGKNGDSRSLFLFLSRGRPLIETIWSYPYFCAIKENLFPFSILLYQFTKSLYKASYSCKNNKCYFFYLI